MTRRHLEEGREMLAASFDRYLKRQLGLCQWFALCERPATGTTPHPILGNVPTCDRCHTFATGEGRAVKL